MYKNNPYIPSVSSLSNNSFHREDHKFLKENGFNIVRLGISWGGFEPEKNNFSDSYMMQVKNIVKELSSHEIYTIIDLHQDAVSSIFCGEGFPSWLVQDMYNNHPDFFTSYIPFVPSVTDHITNFSFETVNPRELGNCKANVFIDYLTTKEVMGFWRLLYQNSEYQDFLATFWKRVNTYFDDEPYVIGYNIVNEPVGSFMRDLPGILDKEKNIGLMYKKIYKELETSKLLLLESFTVPDGLLVSIPIYGGTKMLDISDTFLNDLENIPNAVLNQHLYPNGFIIPNPESIGNTMIQNKSGIVSIHPLDHVYTETFLDTRIISANKISKPLVMTEYGSCDQEYCTESIRYLLKKSGSKMIATMYWQYKYYDDFTSTLIPPQGQGIAFVQNNSLQFNPLREFQFSIPYIVKLGCNLNADISYNLNNDSNSMSFNCTGTGQKTIVFSKQTTTNQNCSIKDNHFYECICNENETCEFHFT